MNLKKRRNPVMAEINITPFTDVVLVLLIIFMITTPMLMQPQIKINLPKAQISDNENVSNIDVLISAKGFVYINGEQISFNQIEDTIEKLVKKYPQKAVVIKADKEVKYNTVIKTMEQARKGGAGKFAFAVDRQPEK